MSNIIEYQYLAGADSVTELLDAFDTFLSEHPGWKVVFKRFFLSDVSQKVSFPQERGAVSYIIQPPLDGSRVAVWAYMVRGANDIICSDACTQVSEDGVVHLWHSGLVGEGSDSAVQTDRILCRYDSMLREEGMSIADNCVRTWFFCHDIDNNYSGLVQARREKFMAIGLTSASHYIASAGIEGTPVSQDRLVQMDAYAIKGNIRQQYLYAPTHMNPTYEYGVTFERAVLLDLPGRQCCLVSGTASIDNKGSVLHVGDVSAQTARMLENISVLLSEADMSWSDVTMALVYLRNASDYPVVAQMLSDRLPGIPHLIFEAPVCRPEWLIEMECIGMRTNH